MAEMSTTSKTALRTTVWLALFVLLAFGLRAYPGSQVGFDATTQKNLETGNDPYYHERTVTHVLTTGENLNYDTAINYPEGNMNPNPPLWTWTTAPLAAGLQSMGVADPVGTALNIMVCVWGALTVIPVYMIGRDLWGRKAGLWGAFFIAVSAPHIQRSVWGYADHDAISLFFVVLAFAFLVKALKAMRNDRFVADWRKGDAIGKGLGAAVKSNRNALVYSTLAGLALTACADTWKGYPYAVAILAVAAGIQLILDHLRRRDATATFLVYAVITTVAAVLPYILVYQHFSNYLPHTVQPSLYVLLGIVVAGLLLVPTRDLPSVLVFPAILVAGALGLVVLLVLFPATGRDLFSGLGYFAQSKLYSTIAEAQRPSLGEVAANFGFFTFLLGFWGFGHAIRKGLKGDAANLFTAAWAAVALFMTFAASRFTVNAAPLFSILVGFAMARIMQKLGLDEVKRKFASMHGQGLAGRAVRATSGKAVVGVLLVSAFLILPNVWTGVDAAMPTEFEVKNGLIHGGSNANNKFGAFGIDFELGKGGSQQGWSDAMGDLAKYDTQLPLEERCAFIGWWDYGHWATGLGLHPTVADPFQSHFELSGRFLASDSEEEAIGWLTIHLLMADAIIHDGGHTFSPKVQAVLQSEAPALMAMPLGYGNYDEAYTLFHATVAGEAVATLYQHVEDATGKCVGYLGVDRRMFPYDDPSTNGVESASIFYAPVFLANKNPDQYMQAQFRSGNTVLNVERYGVDPQGNSYALDEPVYKDTSGNLYTVYQGYAFRAGHTPLQDSRVSLQSGIPLFSSTESMVVTSKFYNTMFGKAFGSIAAAAPSGDGLAHFRLLHQATEPSGQAGVDIRDVALLAYYRGIEVSGRVQDSSGAPLKDLQVTFADGSGAKHQLATTGADGSFKVLAPFSINGDVKIEVLAAGNVILSDNRTALQFTLDEARHGGDYGGVVLTLQQGSLSGRAYEDVNGNGAFDANDTVLSGVNVAVGSATTSTGNDGRYSLANLAPGSVQVEGRLSGYQNFTSTQVIGSGAVQVLDMALQIKTSTASISLFEKNGTTIITVPITITGPTTTSVYTNAQGVATTNLKPGSYTLDVDYQGTSGQVTAHGTLTVPVGGQPLSTILFRQ